VSTSFFICFRLKGFAREYARWVRTRVIRKAKELKIRRFKYRFKLHITLFDQAKTQNLKGVIGNVGKVGRKYSLVPFKLGGFDQFQNPDKDEYWLYLNVKPSSELEQLRYELSQSLLDSDRAIKKNFDHGTRYKFHCSIIKCESRGDRKFRGKFTELIKYAETMCTLENFRQHRVSVFRKLVNIVTKYIFRAEESDPNIHLHLLRIRVSGKGKREYDLLLKKLLTGRNVWSRYWWRKSIEALKTELHPPREDRLSVSDASKCYFIADTHFNHETVRRKLRRRFQNTKDMDREIIKEWNKSVGENDRVYFVGDYTGPPRRGYFEDLRNYTIQLTGNIVSIMGNHDRNGGCIKFEKARILHIDKYTFLLIHNPTDNYISKIKTKYDWIIHGHVHNNNVEKYPFINGEKKTINVSVELINYKPMSLGFLLSLNLNSIKRIDSQLEHW